MLCVCVLNAARGHQVRIPQSELSPISVNFSFTSEANHKTLLSYYGNMCFWPHPFHVRFSTEAELSLMSSTDSVLYVCNPVRLKRPSGPIPLEHTVRKGLRVQWERSQRLYIKIFSFSSECDFITSYFQ